MNDDDEGLCEARISLLLAMDVEGLDVTTKPNEDERNRSYDTMFHFEVRLQEERLKLSP